MTEGRQHDKSMCIRIWLEVGHACEPQRSSSGRADWRVWVRGVAGADISNFVHKVVFHLHPATEFVYPKRVLQEPPYEIQESGCASIEIPIHVYLKYSAKPKRIRLKYSLLIDNSARSSSETRCIYYDFGNPSEQLRQCLMRAGGEVIARTGALTHPGSLLVVLSDSGEERPRHSKQRKYEFVEPIQTKEHYEKKVYDRSKCESPVDFRSLLRRVSMTEDEIKHVSQLYLSYSSYEKSGDALPLPPLSDPIYQVPELPASLRRALTSVEADYAMQ
ncbi:protein ENL-like [Cydia strobilella]|uniref:protein ENL-like n=1 Tax=Cydia strobilella TaxID=1100964 RepID=UPI003004D3D1